MNHSHHVVCYVVWNILDFGKGEGVAACVCMNVCVCGHFSLMPSVKGD